MDDAGDDVGGLQEAQEAQEAIERRQREAAEGLRAASPSRSPRRRSPARHSPPRRRTSSRADKRDGADSARSHAAGAPATAEANSPSPPATTEGRIGGWRESPQASPPQARRRAGMADEGMPKRRVRSGDTAAPRCVTVLPGR